MKASKFRLACLVLPLAAAWAAPAAADWRPDAAYVQGGWSPNHAASGTAGLVWDTGWRRPVWGWEASVQAEAFVSALRARNAGGHRWFAQVGLLPMLRLRLDAGRSPWFLEGGIGISYTGRLYRTDDKVFSTRLNFYDVLGVGYSWGGGRHELGLRVVHISNASIREPNPGEEFVQLRYARGF